MLAVSSMHWIAFLRKTGQFRCAAAQRNYLDSVFCGAYSPFLSGWFMLTDDLENFCLWLFISPTKTGSMPMWPIFALICPWKRSHGFAWVCYGALSLGHGGVPPRWHCASLAAAQFIRDLSLVMPISGKAALPNLL